MKKILEKNFLLITFFLFFLLFVQNCSQSKKTKIIIKKIENLESDLEKINSEKLNTVYYEKFLELNNLILSKNILYDWNSIVRTNVRPDDKMNEYDKSIKILIDEINKLDK
jgi:hypothetical protein